MSERDFVEIEVRTNDRADEDLIDILGRHFLTQLYTVPLSILADYGCRVYSAIRESSFLKFPLGGGISAIIYYLNELKDGIRKIMIWAVDIESSAESA